MMVYINYLLSLELQKYNLNLIIKFFLSTRSFLPLFDLDVSKYISQSDCHLRPLCLLMTFDSFFSGSDGWRCQSLISKSARKGWYSSPNMVWYTSQLKYIFRLQDVSPVLAQHSLTPQGNNYLNFRLARDQDVHIETAANLCASRRQTNTLLAYFFLFLSWEVWQITGPQGKQ